jgi:hypothetical protein
MVLFFNYILSAVFTFFNVLERLNDCELTLIIVNVLLVEIVVLSATKQWQSAKTEFQNYQLIVLLLLLLFL